MAEYILAILKNQISIMWSWGFNSPRKLENGLMFKVDGFLHKGWVKVEYNEGTDLFDITLLSNKMEEKQRFNSVYFDLLVGVIDETVEHCKNYEQKVRNEYSLL